MGRAQGRLLRAQGAGPIAQDSGLRAQGEEHRVDCSGQIAQGSGRRPEGAG